MRSERIHYKSRDILFVLQTKLYTFIVLRSFSLIFDDLIDSRISMNDLGTEYLFYRSIPRYLLVFFLFFIVLIYDNFRLDSEHGPTNR